ncbi:hypothetical protein D3C84_871930 [compost metagenome]
MLFEIADKLHSLALLALRPGDDRLDGAQNLDGRLSMSSVFCDDSCELTRSSCQVSTNLLYRLQHFGSSLTSPYHATACRVKPIRSEAHFVRPLCHLLQVLLSLLTKNVNDLLRLFALLLYQFYQTSNLLLQTINNALGHSTNVR